MSDRVPVQGDGPIPRRQGRECHPPGTITREEHGRVWENYAKRYGRNQSAARIAERGGFSYLEIVDLTGSPPETWEPR